MNKIVHDLGLDVHNETIAEAVVDRRRLTAGAESADVRTSHLGPRSSQAWVRKRSFLPKTAAMETLIAPASQVVPSEVHAF
jgi:hypothetical protein